MGRVRIALRWVSEPCRRVGVPDRRQHHGLATRSRGRRGIRHGERTIAGRAIGHRTRIGAIDLDVLVAVGASDALVHGKPVVWSFLGAVKTDPPYRPASILATRTANQSASACNPRARKLDSSWR